jgi:hypothetical protein
MSAPPPRSHVPKRGSWVDYFKEMQGDSEAEVCGGARSAIPSRAIATGHSKDSGNLQRGEWWPSALFDY